jgi:hypothetical protein
MQLAGEVGGGAESVSILAQSLTAGIHQYARENRSCAEVAVESTVSHPNVGALSSVLGSEPKIGSTPLCGRCIT